MNKEKYREVVTEELGKASDGSDISDPANWPPTKKKLEKFIKEVDKAHEVYTLENPPAKEK